MRNVYLICYDICDAKRLRQVHRIMKGAGDSMQYSVYRCSLSPAEKQDLMTMLWEVVNLGVDRVLFANLGAEEHRGRESLEYWGDPREAPEFTRPIVL